MSKKRRHIWATKAQRKDDADEVAKSHVRIKRQGHYREMGEFTDAELAALQAKLQRWIRDGTGGPSGLPMSSEALSRY